MKKQAKDLNKGERIMLAEQSCIIEGIELSEIGKHGKKKCRIVAITPKNERIVLIRPEDYPFEIL